MTTQPVLVRPWHKLVLGDTKVCLVKLTPRELGFSEPAPGRNLIDPKRLHEWNRENQERLDSGSIDLLQTNLTQNLARELSDEPADVVGVMEFGRVVRLEYGRSSYSISLPDLAGLWQLDESIVYRLYQG